jgi:hypothetical protein
MLNRNDLVVLFMTRPERGADEVLRLREALQQAGETHPDAKKIADEALATWPQVDTFRSPQKR